MEKLGAVVLNCPLDISEHIVSSATCPLVYLGKSTMSLIDVSLINDTACIESKIQKPKFERPLLEIAFLGLCGAKITCPLTCFLASLLWRLSLLKSGQKGDHDVIQEGKCNADKCIAKFQEVIF